MSAGRTLITGATRGIGLQISRVFAAQGHPLVLVARDAERLERLRDQLRSSHGVQCQTIAQDLTQPDAATRVWAQVQQPVDILVNNAALQQTQPLAQTSLEDALAMPRLNAELPTALVRLALPSMLERRWGRIVNVASLAGLQPLPSLAVYSATKAYLIALSEALFEELRGTGVTVTAVCPGITDTPMVQRARAHNAALDRVLSMVGSAEPEDVAWQTYDACMRAVPVHVPGVANQWFTQLSRLQPRWWGRSVSGFFGRQIM